MTKGGGGVSQKMTIADEGGKGQINVKLIEFGSAKYVGREDN